LEENDSDDVMKKIIAELVDVDFEYRIVHGASSSLKENTLNTLRRRISTTNHQALNNINLKLYEGETLAILGRNGAGKSTLLKLLSGVLPPTKGHVRTVGPIAPMIELGAGFNPELTGEENTLLYSAILGRKTKQTRIDLDAIATWSGLEEYFYRPIRTYSSGMIARLAFAIATGEVPRLLIIDEVLSVGDEEFQKKSHARMQGMMSKETGVILVTHNLDTALKMATRGIWLDKGIIRMDSKIDLVINAYLNSVKVD
jgi:ABC-2 type transport system ATP-binding protein